MITKIGRNDVVRIMRTGEVGTVKGWADHEQLDHNGTIIDVEVAQGKTVQANGLALELVALAKLQNSKLAMWATILTALAITFAVTYRLAQEGVSPLLIVAVGLSFYVSVDRALTAMFLRKRVRVSLPKTKTTTARKQRSVNK
jgi:hypothetical protein